VRASVAVAACLCLGAGLAVADEADDTGLAFPVSVDCVATPETEAAARAIAAYWFEQGMAQVDRRAFVEAELSFGCSYAILPHPATLYNFARAADWAVDDRTALRAFRLYLEQVPDAENHAEIDQVVLALVAQLESMGGDVPPPASSQHPSGPPPAPPDEGPDLQRAFGWTAVGLAAAGAVVGSVFAGLAARERSAIEDAPEGTPWSEAAEHESRAWDYDLATFVGFGVAGAGALVGILLLVLDDEDDVVASPFQVMPSVEGDAVGLSVVGRF